MQYEALKVPQDAMLSEYMHKLCSIIQTNVSCMVLDIICKATQHTPSKHTKVLSIKNKVLSIKEITQKQICKQINGRCVVIKGC